MAPFALTPPYAFAGLGNGATLRDAASWYEVVTELGYEHLKRHGLRRTDLTWMADASVPLIAPKIAGHGSLMTTERYLHPDHRSVADAGVAVTAPAVLD